MASYLLTQSVSSESFLGSHSHFYKLSIRPCDLAAALVQDTLASMEHGLGTDCLSNCKVKSAILFGLE